MDVYECRTCGERVRGLKEARKHAKQGHRTQRDAYMAGELHSLHLVQSTETIIIKVR